MAGLAVLSEEDQRIVAGVVGRARSIVESGEALYPVAFVIAHPQVTIYALDFRTERTKALSAAFVRARARKGGARLVVVVAEAWVVKVRAGVEALERVLRGPAPSVDANREEMASFYVETVGASVAGAARIETVDGRRTFGAVSWGESVGGLISGILTDARESMN